MNGVEDALTPEAVVAMFAASGIKISERTLRERARKLGAYRQFGKAMFFMPSDIEAMLEAAKPAAGRQPEASTVSAWTEADTDALIKKVSPARKRRRVD